MNGTHAREGVFAAAGPGVRAAGDVGVCEIVDVMPTLLALAGSPIPGGLDGAPMTAALAAPPSYGASRADESPPARVELDAASEADMAARLEALGYLEPRS
jgi:arylsulfatase A-like enzyme